MIKLLQNIDITRKFKISITVLSLLSLIPFGILLYHLYQLQLISSTEINNDVLVDEVLSRTISSPLILIGFVIGLIIWITNSILSSIGIHKKIIKPFFGYATLILGGLGIHIFILFFAWAKNKLSNKHVKSNEKAGIIATVSSISVFSGILVAFFGMGISVNNFDAPVLGQPVQLSTESSNPNIIEIFTDGFDQWNKDQFKQDSDFNDFNWFSKYQTIGTATHRSVPSIWGDFSDMNPFALRKANKIENPEKLSSYVYGKGFLDTAIKHMEQNKDKLSQRSIINTICMSDDPGYSPATSGTPEAIKKLDPNLNITNWSGARDYNAGKFGVSNTSPDGNSYKYFTNSAEASNKIIANDNGNIVETTNKGSHVLMCDLITHKPYLTAASGEHTIFNISAEAQKTVLRNDLKGVFRKLKALQMPIDPQQPDGVKRSVYDNSMIIVYGDHANHYRKLRDAKGDVVKYRHAESALMIKYPDYTGASIKRTEMNVIEDVVISSASTNKIMNHFMDNRFESPADQLNWIENDITFDPSLSRPVFYDDSHFEVVKWKDPKTSSFLVPSNATGKYIYSYDEWKNLDSSKDPLESMVY